MSIFSRMKTVFSAFREKNITSNVNDVDDFCSVEGRRSRYALYWAAVEGNLYSNVHPWSTTLRATYGLYRYTREIFNPAYRLAEFYRTVIWGGALDLHKAQKGAIPIVVGVNDKSIEKALRACITKIWRDSNWAIHKGTCAYIGAALGDVGIKVVDDTEKGRVYLEIVHPADIVSVERDMYGNVKGYVIEKVMRIGDKDVVYRETAERVKDADGRNTPKVLYRTYKDNELFAWNGREAEWEMDYGFVPMVLIQHNNVGLEWGWAEIHPTFRKLLELDDIASLLHDMVRKTVNPPFYANFSPAEVRRVVASQTTPTQDKPQPGREEIPILYITKTDASIKPLLASLDMASAVNEVQNMIREFERDYPELQMDIWRIERDVSALAMSRVRKRVERKVMDRRENYDNALTRALQMAIAIGGSGRYEGFEAFNLDSYQKGHMNFWVDSERPVFDIDESELVEHQLRFWQAANMGAQVVPVKTVLEDMGWTDEKLEKLSS